MASDPPATSLVALRDRREQVIARISDCYAADVIDLDDLDRRLDLAHAARTVADLDVLGADLAPSTALVVSSSRAIAVEDPSRADRRRLRVIMGSVERQGRWLVPRTLDARVFWGNLELDFRDASLSPGVTTVLVSVTMANLEVIVPPWLEVDVDLSSFAGSVESRHRTSPDLDPQRPVLRFEGAVRFGNFEIETRLPGESRRQAHKRRRREQKALPSGG